MYSRGISRLSNRGGCNPFLQHISRVNPSQLTATRGIASKLFVAGNPMLPKKFMVFLGIYATV